MFQFLDVSWRLTFHWVIVLDFPLLFSVVIVRGKNSIRMSNYDKYKPMLQYFLLVSILNSLCEIQTTIRLSENFTGMFTINEVIIKNIRHSHIYGL